MCCARQTPRNRLEIPQKFAEISTPRRIFSFSSLAKRHFFQCERFVWCDFDMKHSEQKKKKTSARVYVCAPSRHYYIDETRLRFLNKKKRKARRRSSKNAIVFFAGLLKRLYGVLGCGASVAYDAVELLFS